MKSKHELKETESETLKPYARKPKDHQLLELWAKGYTYQEIANVWNVSRQAVHERHTIIRKRKEK